MGGGEGEGGHCVLWELGLGGGYGSVGSGRVRRSVCAIQRVNSLAVHDR